MGKYQVYLGRCHDYAPELIKEAIERGLKDLGCIDEIKGNVVIKPNLVYAHPKFATSSYTRPEVIEGLLMNITKNPSQIKKIDMVERSGAGASTRMMAKNAGYYPLFRRFGINFCPLEETERVRVSLKRGKIHSSISIAKSMAQRDYLIFMPKLKSNVVGQGMTSALKLNVGSLMDNERMFHHRWDMPDKIVDMLEAVNPDLIVTDAIEIGMGGNQMTEKGKHLGMIIMSKNAVAHDIVCASIMNLEPMDIQYLREAHRRGYGPGSIDQIEILGDYPIDEAQKITSKYENGYMPVDRFKSPFRIISGTPYCYPGCQGVFLDWLYMIKDRKPWLIDKFPPITVIIGAVDDEIEDENILLIGDCAMASKRLRASKIKKILGCPPWHRDIILEMALKYLLISPLIRPDTVFDSYVMYPIRRLKGYIRNLKMNSFR